MLLSQRERERKKKLSFKSIAQEEHHPSAGGFVLLLPINH